MSKIETLGEMDVAEAQAMRKNLDQLLANVNELKQQLHTMSLVAAQRKLALMHYGLRECHKHIHPNPLDPNNTSPSACVRCRGFGWYHELQEKDDE